MGAAEKEKPPRAGTQGGFKNNNNGETKDSTPTTCKEVARAVVENGYLPIPIKRGDKLPAMKSWQQARLTAEELVQRYHEHGVGILTGQGDCPLVAVDIDSTDEGLVADFIAWCLDHLGKAPERVGRAPKALLLYRAAEPGWRKQQSEKFVDKVGALHQLEILGYPQQFVAFGIHPATGAPYQWGAAERLMGFGTVDDPTTMRADALPVITTVQVEALLAAFERLALARGMYVAGSRAKERAEASLGTRSTNPILDETMQSRPLGDVPLERAARYLQYMNPADYDTWLHCGMVLHHEYGGSPDALALWDQWSSQAPNYVDLEDLAKRWDGFGRTGRTSLTMRWLIKTAGSRERKPVAAPGERFPLVHAGDYAQRPFPKWTIRDVVPEQGIVVIFGPSGSGKSFFALDLAASIARGKAWRGRDTLSGGVVYLCAEGQGGFRKRLRAYEQENEVPLMTAPLWVIEQVPDFREVVDIDDIVISIRDTCSEPLRAVFVDTLAQVIAGADENAAKEMAPVFRNCERLASELGAAVVLIAHTGKEEAKGMRGWSGSTAAVDVALQITSPFGRGFAYPKVATGGKVKDGEEGETFGFKLRKVLLEGDDVPDGESSCVVDHTDVTTQPKRPRGATQQAVLEAVRAADLVSDGATVEEVIGEVVPTMTAPDQGKEDKRAANVRRSIKTLIKDGLLSDRGGKLTTGFSNMQKFADDDDRSSIKTDQDRS